ncbi:MAG: TetR/AcrR family transcriptional regulator [Spirochaetota bacterium]
MPKIVNHRQYRSELLEKSAGTFSRHNYADVSMRDIAKDIGVSTGTLYHYFPSKEELFCALFLHTAQSSAAEVVDAMCNLTTFEERLDRLFDYFLGRCDRMRRQFLFSADMLRNALPHKAHKLLNRWASELERRLSGVLGLDSQTGLAVFLFLAGSLYAGQVLPTSRDLEPGFNAMKQMLLQQHKNKGKGK